MEVSQFDRLCTLRPMRFVKYFGRYDSKQLEKFANWHSSNPEVYEEFRTIAGETLDAGRLYYSSVIIINILRWHRDLKSTDSEDSFRISNNFAPMYARMLTFEDRKFEGFFSMKGLDRKEEKKLEGAQSASTI